MTNDIKMEKRSVLIPNNLRTNNLENPLGLGFGVPELSWAYQFCETTVRQAAWQIRAAATADALSDGPLLWDSGWVESASSVAHPYGGPELSSRARVFWQVRVRDSDGCESEWSNAANFEMGLIDWKDWDAMWVGFPGGWSGHAIDILMPFKLESAVSVGRLYLSSPGWIEVWCNGKRLGDIDELQPGQCDFSQSVHFLTYDITPFIVGGENRIAVRAGAGWYGTPAIKYRIECDGRLILRSHYMMNSSCSASPVCRNSVYGGEEYDARLEHDPSWLLPGGKVGICRPSMHIGGPAGRPRGLEEEPIRQQTPMKVAKWTRLADGRFVADFGQNFAGVCRLHTTAPAGTSISLKFAEVLKDDGSTNRDNLMGDIAMDVYTTKGFTDGETYQPHFTYHGFRYVEVEGLPGEPDENTLVGIPLRTDCRAVGEFSCSNPLLNRIWKMIRNTEASNIHAVPTDCPQRTERMGWLNDMMARCETAMYIFDESNLLTKWLRDIADAQDPQTGEVPMTAPCYWGFDIDPVCSSFVEAAYFNYLFHGKLSMLKELYPNLRAWIDRMKSCCDEDGILRRGGFVGDWVPPLYDRGDTNARNFSVPQGLVSTALMHYATCLLRKIAVILGNDSDAAALADLADGIRDDFCRAFRSAPSRLNPESQSAYAYALYCGLFPEEERQSAADRLAELFKQHGCKHTTGNIGTKYLLETLSSYGYADLAYNLVASEDYPGWGYMLANGATTLWERWEKAEGVGMNSHNHPMLGCPGVWFFKYLGGIRRAEDSAGFDHFILKPTFVKGLSNVSVSYNSRAGMIRSSWKRVQGGIECSFEVPTNCCATLSLPGRDDVELSAGTHSFVIA